MVGLDGVSVGNQPNWETLVVCLTADMESPLLGEGWDSGWPTMVELAGY